MATEIADRARRPLPVTRRRAERFWTQRRLADEAGVSSATIIRAEHGEAISMISQARIAAALGSTIDELFPEDDAA